MNTNRICAQCGTPLPPDAPAGLCPICLLQSAAPTHRTDTAADSQPLSRWVPVPGGEFGGYRIIRLLGRGGMGEVYEAEHTATGRRVALKAMSRGLTSEADRKRFLREGRLAASVNHPNVVYVHGTEEVGSVPIMAMELVHGGTLKDRLKTEGPLPVADVIDAALQIIDGLEAAQAAGVLHRDIKPANCFIAADGTVKIGDFGLSVSTMARGESLLTATGTVLGTPAYASPEQLRGEELQVTSDIYSVAATLYHLLTGQPPFPGSDFVKLITEVLDKTPPAPHSVRPGIPLELSRILLRGLAKEPRARFRSYTEFRAALLPFRRQAAEPARPSRRVLASLLDDAIVASLPTWLVLIQAGSEPLEALTRQPTFGAFLLWLGCFAWGVGYYAVCEGLWGAGLGKSWCGLRVVGPDGQLPGWPRALFRALLFSLPPTLCPLVLLVSRFLAGTHAEPVQDGSPLADAIGLALFVALFSTMRVRNGFAGVHELLSRTRVVVRPTIEPRPAAADLPRLVPALREAGLGLVPQGAKTASATLAAASANASQVAGREPVLNQLGPYQVQSLLRRDEDGELWLGLDPVLRRPVWLQLRRTETPPTTPARQDLSRPTRLRWLDGGTTPIHRWDAYEAVPGVALLALESPAPWMIARFWLQDLANELIAAGNPALRTAKGALDRLWIAANGRMLLLDFVCPGLPTAAATALEVQPLDEARGAQRFLTVVARRALEGPTPDAPTGDLDPHPPACPVPRQARGFLETLARGAFENLEFVAGNLAALVTKPAALSRARRVVSLALAPVLLVALAVLVAVAVRFDNLRRDQAWAEVYPGRPHLFAASQLYVQAVALQDDRPNREEELRLIRIYLIATYADVITNSAFWANARLTSDLNRFERALLRQVVADFPAPTSVESEEARRLIEPRVRAIERSDKVDTWGIVIGTVCFGLSLVAVGDFLACLRGVPGLMLSLLGIVAVNRRGEPAGRLRLVLRWSLAWLPLVALLVLGAFLPGVAEVAASLAFPFGGAWIALAEPTSRTLFVLTAALVFGALAAVIWQPARGLPDRLAGTWLVPK